MSSSIAVYLLLIVCIAGVGWSLSARRKRVAPDPLSGWESVEEMNRSFEHPSLYRTREAKPRRPVPFREGSIWLDRKGGKREVVRATASHIEWKRPDMRGKTSTRCTAKQWAKGVVRAVKP